MAGIFNVITKFFGNKYDKDIKKIRPIILEIHKEYEKISQLSNNNLREQTNILKNKITDYISEEKKEISNLKTNSNQEFTSVQDKEKIYEQIDILEKEIVIKIEEVLNTILPTAFAVMKETAKRFQENNTISVQATEFDKELASKKDFVSIEKNNAIYRNSWNAAGVEVTWDMVHFDKMFITLPPEITKTHRARNVPLQPKALEILRALPRSINGKIFPIGLKLTYRLFL